MAIDPVWIYRVAGNLNNPGAGVVTFDQAPLLLTFATAIGIATATAAGDDVGPAIDDLAVGDVITATRDGQAATWVNLIVTGAPIGGGSSRRIAITVAEGNNYTALVDGDRLRIARLATAPPALDVPALVTFGDAKTHLKVPDADHDAEIADKLAHATGFIVGYLKDRADPTWTPATVPPEVRAAVLLYLTLLYVHRDDWLEHGYETGTYTGIENLLRRRRDPAIA